MLCGDVVGYQHFTGPCASIFRVEWGLEVDRLYERQFQVVVETHLGQYKVVEDGALKRTTTGCKGGGIETCPEE
jgi:hypothetical protein